MQSNLKVALVHDYLKEYGGAERVLEALHKIYPEAPIYTSFVDFGGLGPHGKRMRKWKIKKSWMHYIWPIKKLHSPLRFIAPLVWAFFNFKGYDVAISSSGWFISRGVRVPEGTIHICYLHHPPRHLYGYATAVEWKRFLSVRIYATIVNHFLRIYDYYAAQKVDYFIANSRETQRRCWKFYRRESTVIYPPVKISNFPALPAGRQFPISKQKSEGYYLCVSRLARAKHIDLAIEACLKLGKPLKIVGKGRDEGYLKSQVTSHKSQVNLVEFLGEVSDEELDKVYAGAKALIFPAEDEEFGIVSVEAQARGIPVIGYKSGGIPETIVDVRRRVRGATGILFDELTVESLRGALVSFEEIASSFKPQDCVKNAQKFSEARFEREIKDFVKKVEQKKR